MPRHEPWNSQETTKAVLRRGNNRQGGDERLREILRIRHCLELGEGWPANRSSGPAVEGGPPPLGSESWPSYGGQPPPDHGAEVGGPKLASWNQFGKWLRRVEALRDAA